MLTDRVVMFVVILKVRIVVLELRESKALIPGPKRARTLRSDDTDGKAGASQGSGLLLLILQNAPALHDFPGHSADQPRFLLSSELQVRTWVVASSLTKPSSIQSCRSSSHLLFSLLLSALPSITAHASTSKSCTQASSASSSEDPASFCTRYPFLTMVCSVRFSDIGGSSISLVFATRRFATCSNDLISSTGCASGGRSS